MHSLVHTLCRPTCSAGLRYMEMGQIIQLHLLLIILKRPWNPNSYFSEKGCLPSTNMKDPWELCSSLLINEPQAGALMGLQWPGPAPWEHWACLIERTFFTQVDSDAGVRWDLASDSFTQGLCKLGQDLPGQWPPSKRLRSHPSSPTTIPTVLNTTCLEGQLEASSRLQVRGERVRGRAVILSWPCCLVTWVGVAQ